MTERGQKALVRDANHFAVGPSSLSRDGDQLIIAIDEVAMPFPRRVKGRIVIDPKIQNERRFDLDAKGRHRWMPLHPVAHADVAFEAPDMRWSGHAYMDTNAGDEPVAGAFRSWDSSRADAVGGSAVLYDTVASDGSRRSIATFFDAQGGTRDFEPPPRVTLPRSKWGVARGTQ
ncbi:MAG: hypothetical protein WCH83_07955, partial [Alphaproteobacteria bacterium]